MRRIAILAASRRELAPVRSALTAVEPGPLRSFKHVAGRIAGTEAHLIATGMGPRSASAAAEAILSVASFDAILSTGYAGALGASKLGNLVVGAEVREWMNDRPGQAYRSDAGLLAQAGEAAGAAAASWSQGLVVTVDRVLWRAEMKQALGRASGAVAVDMESAAIARAAASRNVPFLTIRAISDAADEDLPMDFNLWMTSAGRIRGLAQVLAHPSIVGSLLQLGRRVERASDVLAQFFRFFLVPDELPAMASGRRG